MQKPTQIYIDRYREMETFVNKGSTWQFYITDDPVALEKKITWKKKKNIYK